MRMIILAASASLGLGAAFAACTDSEPLASSSSDDGGVESGPLDSSAPSDSSTPEDAANDGDAGDGGTESMCPLPGTIGSAKCHACVQSKCCTQIATCNGDPGCKAMFLCVSECLPKPDAGGCVEGCFATHDAGDNYFAVDDCVATDAPEGCADDCS